MPFGCKEGSWQVETFPKETLPLILGTNVPLLGKSHPGKGKAEVWCQPEGSLSLGKRLHTVLTLSDCLAGKSGVGTVMDRTTFGSGQLICAPLCPLFKYHHHQNPGYAW